MTDKNDHPEHEAKPAKVKEPKRAECHVCNPGAACVDEKGLKKKRGMPTCFDCLKKAISKKVEPKNARRTR